MYAGGRKQKISSQVAAGHMTTVVVDSNGRNLPNESRSESVSWEIWE
jgi:hypothetical protein